MRDFTPARFHEAESRWLRSLSLVEMKCLIVCRGPVRKEAMDVFDRMGMREYGMLLSEKDSIAYPKCLAPELRGLRFPANVHRVPDYMGVGQEEKAQRIREIIDIAERHGYTHVFAGYGFMAEDAEFIEAIERSAVRFMGPASRVAHEAGAKDRAKKIARRLGVSVTPGVDNVVSSALLRKHKGAAALKKLATRHSLAVDLDGAGDAEEQAEALLRESYAKLVELVTVEELQTEAVELCDELWKQNRGRRLRFKYAGGGGGKGQRVVSRPAEVRAAVMDVLAESKVVAPGSNRNFLIELNVETTRHLEIQLVGNGKWSLALGGRDCSVQMHEQKLLEISLTDEQLAFEIEEARRTGNGARGRLDALEADRRTLTSMEAEAERFGEAVGLDSASTFESIVDGDRHYFMEMNTRIQVEHRVTEQVYRLKFSNPDHRADHFYVDSLVETMALLAAHGDRIDRPERVAHHRAGAEVRINATNAALQPHAGGVIVSWSAPVADEIRDDQGIGIPNPDSRAFVHYRLAGAYDSNVALVVTHGESRRDSLGRLAEILRRTELRGYDLETNLVVHYGLLNWLLGREPLAQASTQFMTYYLAAVGALGKVARDVDLAHAYAKLVARAPDDEARNVLALKQTLLLRPLERLFANAHLLAGFLGRYDGVLFHKEGKRDRLMGNPIAGVRALYQYLNLESRPGRAACEVIWDHDAGILDEADAFYADVARLLGTDDFARIDAALGASKAPAGLDAARFAACKAAHAGFQLGLEVLLLIPAVARAARFDEVRVTSALVPVFPDVLGDAKTRGELHKVLAPAPLANADEIVTPMGGHFYSREAPTLPPLAHEGMRFAAGQALFVIEVMKMFNKVSVPFPGTITKILLPESDGKTVVKGQPIFKIEPDDRRVDEPVEVVAKRRRVLTESLVPPAPA